MNEMARFFLLAPDPRALAPDIIQTHVQAGRVLCELD